MADWFEDQLEKGKLLVRGYVRKDNPMTALLGMDFLVPDNNQWLHVGWAGYSSGEEGQKVLFGTRRWRAKMPWQTAWVEEGTDFYRYPRTDGLHRLVAVRDYDQHRDVKILASADPRLMVHYGILLGELRVASKLGAEGFAQSVLKEKLVGLIRAQLRAWEKVYPMD